MEPVHLLRIIVASRVMSRPSAPPCQRCLRNSIVARCRARFAAHTGALGDRHPDANLRVLTAPMPEDGDASRRRREEACPSRHRA
jgi:hypothetical protein